MAKKHLAPNEHPSAMNGNLREVPGEFDEPESWIEDHIRDEVIVDAYGEEEVMTSWYHYLDEKLNFPFTAVVRTHQFGDDLYCSRVKVVAMAAMARCGYWQMWVLGSLSTKEDTLLHFFLPDIIEVEADTERMLALIAWNYWRRNQHDEMWEE